MDVFFSDDLAVSSSIPSDLYAGFVDPCVENGADLVWIGLQPRGLFHSTLPIMTSITKLTSLPGFRPKIIKDFCFEFLEYCQIHPSRCPVDSENP